MVILRLSCADRRGRVLVREEIYGVGNARPAWGVERSMRGVERSNRIIKRRNGRH
jgi:hypothetical protein